MLHVKNQRGGKLKEKKTAAKPPRQPWVDLSPLGSRPVRMLMLAAGAAGFGLYTPAFYIVSTLITVRGIASGLHALKQILRCSFARVSFQIRHLFPCTISQSLPARIISRFHAPELDDRVENYRDVYLFRKIQGKKVIGLLIAGILLSLLMIESLITVVLCLSVRNVGMCWNVENERIIELLIADVFILPRRQSQKFFYSSWIRI